MSSYGWYAVDLDGTLAKAGKGFNFKIGAPIPAMVARVHAWRAEGKTVKIFTARLSGLDREAGIKNVEDWCIKHLGYKLEVTDVKSAGIIEIWDDRAVGVQFNTGRRNDTIGGYFRRLWAAIRNR